MNRSSNTVLKSMSKYVPLLFITLLLSTSFETVAQFGVDNKRAADVFFLKGDYYSASQYYEKYLGIKGKASLLSYKPYFMARGQLSSGSMKKASGVQQEAIYKLAESYRLYNNFQDAEKWYGESVKQGNTSFPLNKYWYSISLRANNKLADAKVQLVQFTNEYKGDAAYLEKANREINNIDFIEAQMSRKDLKFYKVTRKENGWNAPGANYAPALINPQTIVFTSTRNDGPASEESMHTNYLYQADVTGNNKVQKVTVPVTASMQSGAASFTADGNTMFFTGWVKDNGKSISSIYRSNKEKGDWGEPIKLSEAINAPGFSSRQPFTIPGMLIFSSDRPGGFGGFDLWSAPILNDGNAGTATNMGSIINTKDDEEAPYYEIATKTLVFSSNGRIGMGGFDLYQSKGDLLDNNFTEPKNLGYPINSVKDDIYFVALDKDNMLSNGLFSSDRSSVCCLELFSINKLKQKRTITGKIINCSDGAIIPGATVTVEDTINNRTISSLNTDASGMYSFVLDDYQPLRLHSTMAGYKEGSIQIFHPTDLEAENMMNANLCMVPMPKEEVPTEVTTENKPFVLKNVFFDFNRSTLKSSSYKDLDSVVSILKMNSNKTLDIVGYTDAKGSENYNLELSAARARACLNYIKRKGIPEARLHSKALGKCCPVVPDTNPDGSDNPSNRAQNRRTEFKLSNSN